jgi:rhodanese-related sulfurtransferase
MTSITPAVLAQRLICGQIPKLLDVREPEEHAFAALPNSTLIPLGDIESRANEIEAWKDEEVVVYCHHGVRSAFAIGQLATLGFKKLLNLTGGIDRWSLEVSPGVRRY